MSAAISPWIRSSFFALRHVSVYDFQASRQVERSRSFHVRRMRFAIFSLVASVVEVVAVMMREDEVEVGEGGGGVGQQALTDAKTA